MDVELEIFSGRPNPRWTLAEPAAREVRRLQRALPPASRRSAEPPGLGYRGFCYADAERRCRAWRGTVLTGDGTLDDPARSIERYLLDQLPPEFAMLRARVAAEIDQGQ